MSINRDILRIALPAIVSNITVPLLGLCDTTIAGHLGDAGFIGAIAVGTMMINVVFWCFGFLRSGTSGMTAQAYGSGDREASAVVFSRAFLVAMLTGLLIVALQWPLKALVLAVIHPAADVRALASMYFSIVIWGAPAMLATMSVSGWFLGMQSSFYPMIIAVVTNVINIGLSLLCVYGFSLGFPGTAIGTLGANWCGLLLALWLARRFNGGRMPFSSWRKTVALSGLGRFFRVNTDIFFRSFCIMGVSMGVTSIGARLGNDILALNAVMMQFFMFFSYFMDGFAFAGEALAGKCVGRRDKGQLGRTVRALMGWGAIMAVIFTAIYLLFYGPISSFITDSGAVLSLLDDYRLYLFLIPSLTVGAFLFDGIYIGMTATAAMLWVTLAGAALFFAIDFIGWDAGGLTLSLPDNDRLWSAFLSYLLVRGTGLAMLFRRESRHALIAA